MAEETTCTHCGAPITAGARFCMQCGRDTSGEQSRVATKVAPREPARPKTTQQIQQHLLEVLRDATLGEYEILTELGRGGMATVFLAHDIQLDRKVAIKVMNPQLVAGEGMVERFKLEARTAAGLSHPHIIPIYAVKQTEDLLYFVMKFIEGRPLDSIIKQSAPLPPPMVRTIVAKVGEALGYAHRRGVVHRDIKPANIMIDIEGMPIVTDFGIAKVADKQGLTMTGATIGTPTYMSPEQCNAQPITGASDQYSLGVMAYEMLTGGPLYDGDSVMTIMFKHVHDAVPAPEALGDNVPRDLADAITRMLQKKPEDRWPTIEEALPLVVGTSLAYDDSVRTQMIQFAKAGSQREILARVSTPRSPIPAAARAPTAIESAETVRVSSAPQAPTRAKATAVKPAPPRPAAPEKRSRAGLWVALLVVLLGGGGGALAVLKPWDRSAGTEAATAPAVPPAVSEPVPGQPTPGQQLPTQTTPPAVVSEPPREPAPVAITGDARSVAQVRFLTAPSQLPVGQSAVLQVQVLDQGGRPLAAQARWNSSDPSVAQIDQSGRLVARSPGRTTITAEQGGQRAATSVVVTIVVARVEVTPSEGTLSPGGSLQLFARAIQPDGNAITVAVAWESSNSSVASVSPSGTVTAVGPGTATVTAMAEQVSGSATIQVQRPAATPAQRPPVAQREPAQPEEDARPVLQQLVQQYAAALQEKRIDRVKALFPTMPADRERQTRDALQAMENLQVRLTAADIAVTGTEATARVTGRWTFRGGALDVSNVYQFERRAAGWVIVGILER